MYMSSSATSSTTSSATPSTSTKSSASSPSLFTKKLDTSVDDKMLPSKTTLTTVLLYILSALYLFEKKTIPIGYIILTITYIVTIYFALSNQLGATSFDKYSENLKKFLTITSPTTVIVKTIMFWAFIVIVVSAMLYNLYGISMVTNSVFMRTKQVESYDLNVSNSRWNDLITYNVLFYLTALSFIFIIYCIPKIDGTAKDNYWYIPLFVAFFYIIASTITNYFIQIKISTGLQNDSLNKKSKTEEEIEASDTKVTNQNAFTDVYYWILNFFNNPNI